MQFIQTFLDEWGLTGAIRPYLVLALISQLTIAFIEPNPWFYRSMRRMFVTGSLLAVLKGLATLATIVTLFLLPYNRLQWLILGSLGICGSITLIRELWWRLRSGDRSLSSYIGALSVTLQTMTLLLLVSSVIAAGIEVIIAPARILQSDMDLLDGIRGWVEVMATLLTLVTVYYIGYALIRRILGVTGFSWVDPPNWRTILPHLKYTKALRWGWPPVGDSTLADTVRAAYTEHIVGSTTLDDITMAATIRPVPRPELGFTCAVLGDPGEGDRSQIRPILQQPLITEAIEVSDETNANPGFIVISSDIVYPAGELMDYERTVYRPYRNSEHQPQPLMYGLPGNHDWYNSLKGMLVNFGYPAAFGAIKDETQGKRWQYGLKSGPWARYGLPWGWARWFEARSMREFYAMNGLGGDPARPETHQRLPFWEMDFSPAPLTILGIDTGAVGSLDALQLRWLADRLHFARAKNNLIVALLSEPFYVNGSFADGVALRDLYALLRKHHVEVFMGGDTHAYQHYEVDYTDLDGIARTTHHFVNGGGGAFLAPPIDLRWQASVPLRPNELAWNYTDRDQQIEDRVRLMEYFPTAAQLLSKFTVSVTSSGSLLQRPLRRFESRLLGSGFTTALDHDRSPLYQSFVALTLIPPPEGWILRITPWFTSGDDNALVPQPSIDILRASVPSTVPV